MVRIHRRAAIVPKIVFPITDMVRGAAFYRSLGFEVRSASDDYCWVVHEQAEVLHLALIADLDVESNRAAGYLHVQDAAAWHTQWSDAGVPVGALRDEPWQMREFSVCDPDHNTLRVGQNL